MSKRKRQWEPPSNFASLERSQSSSSSFSIPHLLHRHSNAGHHPHNTSIDQRSLSLDHQVQEANGMAPLAPEEPPDMNAVTSAIAAGEGSSASYNNVAARKFTACEGCRKQKIKCDMPNDEPPCTRCRRRSLPCILNKNMHALLEDSKRSDQALRADVTNLYHTLETVCRHLNLEVPKQLQSARGDSADAPIENGSGAPSGDEPDCEVSPPGSPSAVQAPIDTFLEVVKLTSPGSGDQSLASKKHSQQDIVAKGIITAQVAERLLDRYFNRLDHYLYGIASMYKEPHAARNASPILFAAICTVSALHEPGPDQSIYEACNREFRRLVARSLFDKRDLEYIRALCIASFWLSDAARIFSSDAIRRAGDMRLHRFFRRAVYPPGNEDEASANGNAATAGAAGHLYPTTLTPAQVADRVRLWYLLFVCDSHMSILHNRDSLLRSDREITTDWEAFLERPSREDNDVRILSQTSLLLIMGQVRDTLGAQAEDAQRRLPTSTHGQLSMFSRQLDKWFTRFSAIFKPNPHIGDFPAKGLRLHYHFGKLNLGHHVFQGLHGDPVPDVFIPSALMAHDAAIAIFELILNDEPLQESVVGMPHYFLIMIAFAGHFLLEVCHKYSGQLSLSVHEDLGLINRVLMLFEGMRCHPQHPVRRMTPGLGQRLFECAAKMGIRLDFSDGTLAALGGGGVGGGGHGQAGGTPVATTAVTHAGQNAAAMQYQQHDQQPFDYSQQNNIATAGENWQFTAATAAANASATHFNGMDEMGFTQFGEFDFPNMSLNFMT